MLLTLNMSSLILEISSNKYNKLANLPVTQPKKFFGEITRVPIQ